MTITQVPDFITLHRDQIEEILCAAPAAVYGYRLVSSDDTGEEWRHGHRELSVFTAEGDFFYALERRCPLDEPRDWDCRDQTGPDYRLYRVVPHDVVRTVYRRPGNPPAGAINDDAEPELPPLEKDPVAIRLGIVPDPEERCGRPHIPVPPDTGEPLIDGLTQGERNLLAQRDNAE